MTRMSASRTGADEIEVRAGSGSGEITSCIAHTITVSEARRLAAALADAIGAAQRGCGTSDPEDRWLRTGSAGQAVEFPAGAPGDLFRVDVTDGRARRRTGQLAVLKQAPSGTHALAEITGEWSARREDFDSSEIEWTLHTCTPMTAIPATHRAGLS